MKTALDNEIDKINNDDIRQIVRFVLDNAPNCFWSIPASSTGKYHPEFASGEGGLIRHTKAVVHFAEQICSWTNSFNDEGNIDKDIILAAAILHDSYKVLDGEKYTAFKHPLYAGAAIKICGEKGGFDMDIIDKIRMAVESHMGRWNYDRYGDELLPLPSTSHGKIVSLADYLASRKDLLPQF